ncbi:methyltransferase domain-containing protein [Planobispora siamensis]|nr:methyltransferase domain-containing protein [Planobispora siamensis]
MAHRRSNRQRNRWVVSLLDVQPTDRVLEIGPGPGLAVAELAGRATRGRVYGIDRSQVMVRQAGRRNAAGIRAPGSPRARLRRPALRSFPHGGFSYGERP